MIAGNGIVAGCATELGMSGMAKFYWIDIILVADLRLISVTFDAGNILAHAVAERIVCPLCLSSCRNTGYYEQHHGFAILRYK